MEDYKATIFPESPYSFSVFSSDILGRIYEIFLAQKLEIKDGELVIVNKPENIERDIVTTPNVIVREILHQTASEMIMGKMILKSMRLNVLILHVVQVLFCWNSISS